MDFVGKKLGCWVLVVITANSVGKYQTDFDFPIEAINQFFMATTKLTIYMAK
jgi:hypothetical protein